MKRDRERGNNKGNIWEVSIFFYGKYQIFAFKFIKINFGNQQERERKKEGEGGMEKRQREREILSERGRERVGE